jgi:multicomponent Na+:H+ antiporter subunit E
MKRISSMIFLFVVWVLLSWPFEFQNGKLVDVHMDAVVSGIVVVAVAAILFRHSSEYGVNLPGFLNPVRLFWLFIYVVVFLYSVVRANFDVAYRILHPAMPIRPGIVKVRASLRGPAAITLLANSIALTPGTLTIHAGEDGVMYVHWINVRTTDIDGASAYMIKRFEWFIKRILE